MSIITKMLKQVAVYWAPADPDGYGKPTYVAPIEIKCRWEETQELYINAQGEQKTSRVKVFVDRDIQMKGVLMLGRLIDITDEVNPTQNTNAYEMDGWSKVPNLRQTKILRIAYS